MSATHFTGTTVISVTDNRGLRIRTLNWNRTTVSEKAALQVTHTLKADNTLTMVTRDPRLFSAWQVRQQTSLLSPPSPASPCAETAPTADRTLPRMTQKAALPGLVIRRAPL